MVQPREEKAQEDLAHVNKYLMGEGSEDDGSRLFSVVHSDRMRGNGHKPNYRKLHLDIVETFFYCEGGQTLEQVAERGCVVSVQSVMVYGIL